MERVISSQLYLCCFYWGRTSSLLNTSSNGALWKPWTLLSNGQTFIKLRNPVTQESLQTLLALPHLPGFLILHDVRVMMTDVADLTLIPLQFKPSSHRKCCGPLKGEFYNINFNTIKLSGHSLCKVYTVKTKTLF